MVALKGNLHFLTMIWWWEFGNTNCFDRNSIQKESDEMAVLELLEDLEGWSSTSEMSIWTIDDLLAKFVEFFNDQMPSTRSEWDLPEATQ